MALERGKTVLAGWKEDAKGSRENLRAVWEAISNFLVISLMSGDEVFEKERGEAGWQALEQFIFIIFLLHLIFCETLHPS